MQPSDALLQRQGDQGGGICLDPKVSPNRRFPARDGHHARAAPLFGGPTPTPLSMPLPALARSPSNRAQTDSRSPSSAPCIRTYLSPKNPPMAGTISCAALYPSAADHLTRPACSSPLPSIAAAAPSTWTKTSTAILPTMAPPPRRRSTATTFSGSAALQSLRASPKPASPPSRRPPARHA